VSTNGDWAPNRYKSECGTYQAATGLGVDPGSDDPHGLLCSTDDPNLKHDDMSGCTSFNLEASDNSTYEWDFGSYKGQCATNAFVAGFGAVPGGSVSTILCCPGAVTQQNCMPLTDDMGDNREAGAVAATGDWDSGHYKLECGPGRYIAGVSHKPGGGVHAILCCSP
jgi:hypothetical protein